MSAWWSVAIGIIIASTKQQKVFACDRERERTSFLTLLLYFMDVFDGLGSTRILLEWSVPHICFLQWCVCRAIACRSGKYVNFSSDNTHSTGCMWTHNLCSNLADMGKNMLRAHAYAACTEIVTKCERSALMNRRRHRRTEKIKV